MSLLLWITLPCLDTSGWDKSKKIQTMESQKSKALCAWMLHDDNAWLDIFFHCEDVQFHLGLT